MGEAAGDIPYTAYFAKKSYIEKNADLIQRFTNAVYKGQQWVATHTDAEVAEAAGCRCILVSSGHQSAERLRKTGCTVAAGVSDAVTEALGLTASV